MKIFVVDDDRDFAESMALVFEGRGHEVVLEYSGEKAVERFGKEYFDIVFMDIKLPGMNGVQSFLEIRKMNPESKVVMMTGYSVQQLIDEAIDYGVWGILKKPFDPQQALSLIENLSAGDILIADDDPDFLESLKGLLGDHGYRVCVATDGEQAIRHVVHHPIQILILDLKLPIIRGLDVYYELKKQERLIPTVIVTAYPEEESQAIESLELLGVEDILVKPFDPARLLSILSQVEKNKKGN